MPLNAPGWFDCFDADAIGEALETGEALAFLGSRDIVPTASTASSRSSPTAAAMPGTSSTSKSLDAPSAGGPLTCPIC